jgi:Transposase, Mutator family
MRSRRPRPSESSQSTLVIPCTENTGQLQLDAAPTQRICPGMAKIGGEKIEQYQWIMQLSRVHTADCVMAETKKKWLRPSTPSSRPGASNMTRRSSEDRDALLACYDFPAEHWKHLRTTNIIESSFATVCRRTVGSKGCLSNKTALPFKLAEDC